MNGDGSAGRASEEPVLADPALLRKLLAAFATGVTVVTVAGEHPHGMTANAFSSVSLDPPLVLVCVNREARFHQALAPAAEFGISVLASHQADLARYFSDTGRPEGGAQFASVEWSPGGQTGAPLIAGALAWIECTLWHAYDGGDHSIFVGRLLSASRTNGGDPLVFFDGRFRELATGGAR